MGTVGIGWRHIGLIHLILMRFGWLAGPGMIIKAGTMNGGTGVDRERAEPVGRLDLIPSQIARVPKSNTPYYTKHANRTAGYGGLIGRMVSSFRGSNFKSRRFGALLPDKRGMPVMPSKNPDVPMEIKKKARGGCPGRGRDLNQTTIIGARDSG
jgi:hypothetical protein